ncbi:uncharacterized mitochondrial protein AtMg00860-like [Mangifera indica]|uniref:uncharacterized mitochondrial protein AtMg00860-like n=1 Tax=Mangifera indica TaxID=29780 RepID=UPI001CFC4605|nr:uncharacterized mitochondrial protein AtMg00860-like [Mangifera indica]
MDPSKIDGIVEWQKPKTVKEIRGFLGLMGYYWRFVEGFARPLTTLTKKVMSFQWSNACEASFQELKRKFTTALVLALLDEGVEYNLYINASHDGLGAMLMQ